MTSKCVQSLSSTMLTIYVRHHLVYVWGSFSHNFIDWQKNARTWKTKLTVHRIRSENASIPRNSFKPSKPIKTNRNENTFTHCCCELTPFYFGDYGAMVCWGKSTRVKNDDYMSIDLFPFSVFFSAAASLVFRFNVLYLCIIFHCSSRWQRIATSPWQPNVTFGSWPMNFSNPKPLRVHPKFIPQQVMRPCSHLKSTKNEIGKIWSGIGHYLSEMRAICGDKICSQNVVTFEIPFACVQRPNHMFSLCAARWCLRLQKI